MKNSDRLQMRHYVDEVERLATQNKALLTALHDAINRPKGVVPTSAEPFYDPVRYPAEDTGAPDPKVQAAIYI